MLFTVPFQILSQVPPEFQGPALTGLIVLGFAASYAVVAWAKPFADPR